MEYKKNKKMENNIIIFFDGICNFCNSSVNFIIKRDEKNYFKFASLQSEFVKKFISSYKTTSNDNRSRRVPRSLWTLEIDKKFDSIILFENNKLYLKSTAVLKITKYLNGFWKIFFIFIIIPPFIRDFFYDIIAKNRYKWFGKRDTCMIPDGKDKNKFL